MSKEPGQLAYELWRRLGMRRWGELSERIKLRWVTTEAAVRADATRELVEALERIANVTENWADNLASQVNEIARDALEKAKTPPAV
jgi:SLT domain-containing protein